MEDVFRYKKAIADLLEERPEYRPYQEEIERKLKASGNQHNRLVLIKMLLYDKLKELELALRELL